MKQLGELNLNSVIPPNEFLGALDTGLKEESLQVYILFIELI